MTHIRKVSILGTILVGFACGAAVEAQVYQCSSIWRKKGEERLMKLDLDRGQVGVQDIWGKMNFKSVNCTRSIMNVDGGPAPSVLTCKAYMMDVLIFQELRDMAGRFLAELREGSGGDHFLCGVPPKLEQGRSQRKEEFKAAAEKLKKLETKTPDPLEPPLTPRFGPTMACSDIPACEEKCRRNIPCP